MSSEHGGGGRYNSWPSGGGGHGDGGGGGGGRTMRYPFSTMRAQAESFPGRCGNCFNTGAPAASSVNGIGWCNCPIGQQRKLAAAGAVKK